MATFFHNCFLRNHMWIVGDSLGDLSQIADGAIRQWSQRNVPMSTLIVCGPGDAEKFLATVDMCSNLERITIQLDYGVAVDVDHQVYRMYQYPVFDVKAVWDHGHKYVFHMWGITGGEYLKSEPGPFWLAFVGPQNFVGPRWKDGSITKPDPPPRPGPKLPPQPSGDGFQVVGKRHGRLPPGFKGRGKNR